MAVQTSLQSIKSTMPYSALRQFTASCMIAGLLYGCGSLSVQDGAPAKTMDWDTIPDAVPQDEPLSDKGNPETYTVNGQRYTVNFDTHNFTQRGLASWYGTKFHGKLTSSGEPYDMYKMTAAHKTLPLPSYVQVTNLQTGKKITVKVNDRGPFVDGRIIDLSYAAAQKLGITHNGTARVQLDLVTPEVVAYAAAASPSPVTATAITATPIKQETATTFTATPVNSTPVEQENNEANSSNTDAQAKIETPDNPALNDNTEKGQDSNNYYVQVAAFTQLSLAENFRSQLQGLKITPINISTVNRTDDKLYRVRIVPFSNKQQVQIIETRLSELGYTESLLIVE